MHSLCRAAGVCIESCGKAVPSSTSTSMIQQLCASLLRLYKSVVSSSSMSRASQAESTGPQPVCTPSTEQQQHDHESDPLSPVRHPKNSHLAQQQPEEAAVTSWQREASPSVIQSAHMAVLELSLQSCKACGPDREQELLSVLTLYLLACQILHERGHPIPPQATDIFLRSHTIIRLE